MTTTMPVAPWSPERVARFGAVQAAALAAILGGWFAAAGQHSSKGVWPWLSVCLAGLGLSFVTNAAALFTARRTINRRPVPILDLVEPAVTPETAGASGLVSGEGMTLFHRPDCLLAAGKPVDRADRAAHEQLGRQPCGMCRP